ncbi:unnamed protein product [Urochloa humidicola]
MVLYLIRSISSDENFITRVFDGTKAATSSSSRLRQGKVRRLALQSDGPMEAHVDNMKQVRSFISQGCNIMGGKGRVLLSSFKFIRLLAIHTSSGQCITGYLKPIQNLLHLRCLQLSGTYDVDLPLKELATLKFLQTLDVRGQQRREQVVASVGLLKQLLCLRIRNPVSRMPDGIGKLTSLEELEIYNRHEENREQEPWMRFIEELGSLRELRVLRVGAVPSLKQAQVDMVQSLRNLHKLEHLILSVSHPKVTDTGIETWEEAVDGSLLLPQHLHQLFLHGMIFSRLPSFSINASRLPILSHLLLRLHHLDAQDLTILGELPELCDLELQVLSTVQLVRTNGTDDDACLFRKLRGCTLRWYGVRLLSSADSCGVSIHMGHLDGFIWGSRRMAPTLLPSVEVLQLRMPVQDWKDDNASLVLEYFAWLQKVTVYMDCRGASAAEVEQVVAALQRAADVHPNRPTLELTKWWEPEK